MISLAFILPTVIRRNKKEDHNQVEASDGGDGAPADGDEDSAELDGDDVQESDEDDDDNTPLILEVSHTLFVWLVGWFLAVMYSTPSRLLTQNVFSNPA